MNVTIFNNLYGALTSSTAPETEMGLEAAAKGYVVAFKKFVPTP